jgi:hypothetical protein
MHLAMWWPECFHWPFCPGVFIGILGFFAAVITFWERPPRTVKAACIGLFFALMCCEVWMISEDRKAHDAAEKTARETAQQQVAGINLLGLQAITTNNHLQDIERYISAAKGNPQLLHSLQLQADSARAQIDTISRLLLATARPNPPPAQRLAPASTAQHPQLGPTILSAPSIPHDGQITGRNFGSGGTVFLHLRVKPASQQGPYANNADFLLGGLIVTNYVPLTQPIVQRWDQESIQLKFPQFFCESLMAQVRDVAQRRGIAPPPESDIQACYKVENSDGLTSDCFYPR